MAVDLFLWPMLIPLAIPLYFAAARKKDSLRGVMAVAASSVLIVVLYTTATGPDYYLGKILLFIVLPVAALAIALPKGGYLTAGNYGVSMKGLGASLRWFLVLLPIMLLVNYAVFRATNGTGGGDFLTAVYMFFEAFTEEFFFRGVLFIVLLSLTDIRAAYITSFLCFVLVHPQYYRFGLELPLIVTVVQSALTIEIARRSKNIAGSWLLHGANRFSTYVFGLA